MVQDVKHMLRVILSCMTGHLTFPTSCLPHFSSAACHITQTWQMSCSCNCQKWWWRLNPDPVILKNCGWCQRQCSCFTVAMCLTVPKPKNPSYTHHCPIIETNLPLTCWLKVRPASWCCYPEWPRPPACLCVFWPTVCVGLSPACCLSAYSRSISWIIDRPVVRERERQREKAIESQREGKLHWGEVGALEEKAGCRRGRVRKDRSSKRKRDRIKK